MQNSVDFLWLLTCFSSKYYCFTIYHSVSQQNLLCEDYGLAHALHTCLGWYHNPQLLQPFWLLVLTDDWPLEECFLVRAVFLTNFVWVFVTIRYHADLLLQPRKLYLSLCNSSHKKSQIVTLELSRPQPSVVPKFLVGCSFKVWSRPQLVVSGPFGRKSL
jgi:hypothetical protein